MICKTRVYSYRDWWIISVYLSTVIHRCTLCVRGDIAMRRASRAAARDWLRNHQAARVRLGSHLHTSRAICIPTTHYVPSHPRLIVLYYMYNIMYHTPRWRRQFACDLLPNRITSRLLTPSDKLLDSCSRLLLTDAILMLVFVVVVIKNKICVSIMCFIAHYRTVNEHTILENRDVNKTCKKQWCLWESTGFLEVKEV